MPKEYRVQNKTLNLSEGYQVKPGETVPMADLTEQEIEIYAEQKDVLVPLDTDDEDNDSGETAVQDNSGEDDLTELPGIGANKAADLEAKGITSFEDILRVGPDLLEDVPGIGSAKARDIMEYLGEDPDANPDDANVEVN